MIRQKAQNTHLSYRFYFLLFFDNFIYFVRELKELELVRFVDDGPDDDDFLLCTAEFYGGAVISNDSFWQTSYDHYPEAKSRRIDFRYGKSEVLREDFHKPEVMVDMFTKLIFNNFAREFF
jgi:hypothetical protein